MFHTCHRLARTFSLRFAVQRQLHFHKHFSAKASLFSDFAWRKPEIFLSFQILIKSPQAYFTSPCFFLCVFTFHESCDVNKDGVYGTGPVLSRSERYLCISVSHWYTYQIINSHFTDKTIITDLQDLRFLLAEARRYRAKHGCRQRF